MALRRRLFLVGTAWAVTLLPVDAKSLDVNNETTTTWFFGTAENIRQDMRSTQEHVKQEIVRSKQEMEKNIQKVKHDLEKDVKKMERLLIRSVEKNVFHQRVGWERFRHSVRDGIGFGLGTSVALMGYSCGVLQRGGSVALETSQVGWEVCCLANFPHEPWIQDAVATTVGLASWTLKHHEVAKLSVLIPHLFLLLAQHRTWKNILRDMFYDVNKFPVAFVSWFVSVVGLVIPRRFGIPLEMVAASVAGGRLMVDSIGAEIAGNWLYMLGDFFSYVVPLVKNVLWVFFRILELLLKLIKSLRGLVRPLLPRLHGPVKEVHRSIYLRIASTVLKTRRTVHRARDDFLNHWLTRSLHLLVVRLKSVVRRNRLTILPWAIAATGVSIQMGWARNGRDMRRVFFTSLNPLKPILRKVSVRNIAESLGGITIVTTRRIRASRSNSQKK